MDIRRQCVSLVARYAGLYAVKCSMNFNVYLTPVICGLSSVHRRVAPHHTWAKALLANGGKTGSRRQQKNRLPCCCHAAPNGMASRPHTSLVV